MVGYSNRVMRFLINVTEPLLGPLRRIVPPVGMFDISPIVAFIIVWIFQAAVAGTLLRGWQLNFFQ
jgi:YggT family protein